MMMLPLLSCCFFRLSGSDFFRGQLFPDQQNSKVAVVDIKNAMDDHKAHQKKQHEQS